MLTEKLFFLFIAILLAYLVGCMGQNRRIGFKWAFIISLINVFVGLIVVLCSKKKKAEAIEPQCNQNNPTAQ